MPDRPPYGTNGGYFVNRLPITDYKLPITNHKYAINSWVMRLGSWEAGRRKIEAGRLGFLAYTNHPAGVASHTTGQSNSPLTTHGQRYALTNNIPQAHATALGPIYTLPFTTKIIKVVTMKNLLVVLALFAVFSQTLFADLWSDGLWMWNWANSTDLTPAMSKDSGLANDIFYHTWSSPNTETVYTSYENSSRYNAWCDASLRSLNQVYSISFNSNWAGGGYNPDKDDFSATSGKYYTFRFLVPTTNSGYDNTKAAILETSASPVSIPSITGPVAAPEPNEDVQIDITLSATKSSEERLLVRYTTDDWVTKKVVNGGGSGTAYTADIPGQIANTTVKYYVLTTTAAVEDGNDFASDLDADVLTLAYNNNSGANYTYTTAPEPAMLGAAILIAGLLLRKRM